MNEASDLTNAYDVAIIGGGAAGLAAATVLARARSRVVVLDAGKQSNRVSKAAGAAFSQDKIPPAELYTIVREQLLAYPTASILDTSVTNIQHADTFTLSINSGETLTATLILLAQGMDYELPPIEGLTELWGNKAWHCPYCHGYEAAEKSLLVIVDEKDQEHLRHILPSWTTDFTFVLPDDVKKVAETKSGIVALLKSGEELHAEEILVKTDLVHRDPLAEQLGCTFTDLGRINVDEFGKTNVSGVFAAGDQTLPMTQVNLAVASGHMAGVGLHKELCERKAGVS